MPIFGLQLVMNPQRTQQSSEATFLLTETFRSLILLSFSYLCLCQVDLEHKKKKEDQCITYVFLQYICIM